MLKHAKKRAAQATSRVFIFGAGVSASCGIAVTKDLLRECIKKLTARDGGEGKEIHRLLRYFYKSFDPKLRNYPNIEDFLNLLEVAKIFNEDAFQQSDYWSPRKLDEAEGSLIKAICRYIWAAQRKEQNLRKLKQFVKENLRPLDVVITFNWDLTVELTLQRNGSGSIYSYSGSSEDDGDRILLLKPHGSVNWYEFPPPGPLSFRHSFEDLYEIYYFPAEKWNAIAPPLKPLPVIVPPISRKDFDFPPLSETWRKVYRALRNATRIDVLGYSLPREDQFARFVLRRALRNNILSGERSEKLPLEFHVVNPDPDVEATFYRLLGNLGGRFRFHQAYFEDVAVKFAQISTL